MKIPLNIILYRLSAGYVTPGTRTRLRQDGLSPCYTVLKQYDKEHNTDLCDVFMKYLTYGRSINQTSAAVFMHWNTVLNKVKKAISVMHNEFEDTQTLMAFILSYLNEHM